MAFQKMEGHTKGLVKYSRVFAKKETQVIDVAFWVEDGAPMLTITHASGQHGFDARSDSRRLVRAHDNQSQKNLERVEDGARTHDP